MNVKQMLERGKKKSKKMLDKVKKLDGKYFYRKKYVWYREHLPIEEKAILLESLDGKTPMGNVAAILDELYHNPLYRDYKIYLSGKKNISDGRREYLKAKGYDRVTQLVVDTKEYFKILATAKYLITEVSFFFMFIKRPEQVYLNTWHGTPLKTLGKKVNNDFAMLGNVQKNFFDADYLLCPNEFTMNCLVEDYMLENFAKTKLWLTGYPRNTVLLRKEKRQEIRQACGFGEKQIIAFMPTWRGTMGKIDGREQNRILAEYLTEWDAMLSEEQLLYVNLHHMNKSAIDLTVYKHIRPFPAEYDGYEFLTATDLLVTDYSSVFFDYAITRNKIVLFTYDLEQYMADRGFYLSLDELPFPRVSTVTELMEEINTPKQYDDTAFLERFCKYDDLHVTEALCRKFIFGEETPLIEERTIADNGKKNVVLYIGGFEKNGLTTAASNLLHTLDRTKYNYAVIFCMNSLRKRQDDIRVLPEDVAYMGFYHCRSAVLWEIIPYMLWRELKLLPFAWVKNIVERMAKREADRILTHCRVDKVIQFSGYNEEMIAAMEHMPCSRTIYVHNDMEQEIKTRGIANKGMLNHAYQAYDSVACVTEDIVPPTKRIAEWRRDKSLHPANITVCKNIIDYKKILERGEKELQFDKTTAMNVPQDELLSALASEKKKFVSVGRYSAEKGHARLIKAFERLHKEDQDTCLIIIGGHGVLYDQTVKQVKESSCPDAIFLVRYMSNPLPLVKQCDYFVLSSLYEGFGLVLVEADVLGLPCFSTDIVGPRGFMKKYGGLLVVDSEDGILDGMHACLNGTVPKRLNVDYEQYNREAIEAFETLLQ